MAKAIIVTDLSYGDAGKGTTVDYLARQAGSATVIRHNGGPQAAHNVMTTDGRHHTFAQFGSGSFVPGVRTHLSRFMLINPVNMFVEAEHLETLGVEDIWQRISVDSEAMLITPWHQATNRLREFARGGQRHGSCAQGVGEAMACSIDFPDLTLRVRDIGSGLIDKLQAIRLHFLSLMEAEVGSGVGDDDWQLLRDTTLAYVLDDTYRAWARRVTVVDGSYLSERAAKDEQLIFEGAQGVLLDEWYGFHPYTTWSTTTSANARTLIAEATGIDGIVRLGIMRAYTTRHGPGPFVTEDARLASVIPEYHNGTGQWQGAFRYGHLDLVAHQYAVAANAGVDELVVTGMDRRDAWQVCSRYLPPSADDLSHYFSLSGEHAVYGIKLGQLGDLDYQGRLTELLDACRPQYHSRSVVNGTELLSVIEAHLRVPISLTSYGPTAADKRALVVC